MRKRLAMGFLGLSFLALSGCASVLDEVWETEARNNCNRESGQTRRSDCNDHVDDKIRERRY